MPEGKAMVKTRIVVGVDGSGGAVEAVRWAAAETRLRGVDLRIVTAFHRKSTPDDEAAGILQTAVTQARAVAPDIELRTMALPGYAVPVLLHAAEEAALLVVGSRPDRGLPGLPHGSVRSQVATRAKGTVVVVRGRRDPDTGPVVVGVGEDAGAEPVIGRAFEEAALRGAPLLAVTAQDSARRPGPAAADLLGGDLDGLLAPGGPGSRRHGGPRVHRRRPRQGPRRTLPTGPTRGGGAAPARLRGGAARPHREPAAGTVRLPGADRPLERVADRNSRSGSTAARTRRSRSRFGP